jgi:hypothetical protein
MIVVCINMEGRDLLGHRYEDAIKMNLTAIGLKDADRMQRNVHSPEGHKSHQT